MSYAGLDHEFDIKLQQRADQGESSHEQVRDIVQQQRNAISSPTFNKIDQAAVFKANIARASASIPLGKLLAR